MPFLSFVLFVLAGLNPFPVMVCQPTFVGTKARRLDRLGNIELLALFAFLQLAPVVSNQPLRQAIEYYLVYEKVMKAGFRVYFSGVPSSSIYLEGLP